MFYTSLRYVMSGPELIVTLFGATEVYVRYTLLVSICNVVFITAMRARV